jgi:NAD(P)-dependent dehydrogenase (short-subunit alcohol dehydrogenase family)
VAGTTLALPDLAGTTAVVTGGNAGIGFFTAVRVAQAGGRVVLACRDFERAERAATALRSRVPSAAVQTVQLDLADLGSVHRAADAIARLDRIDALVANGGMVHPPGERRESADGNELVLATNFLGHFALVARLLPSLRSTPGSRVVLLGSLASRLYDFRIGDLQLRAHYAPFRAYAQSKIAMQSFGFELDRRLRAAGDHVASVVAHPGYSISGLTVRIPGVNEPTVGTRMADALQSPFAQSKERGAWPIAHAAAGAGVKGGQYWGPRFLTRGRPTLQTPTHASSSASIGAELWRKAEEYTGVPFPV